MGDKVGRFEGALRGTSAVKGAVFLKVKGLGVINKVASRSVVVGRFRSIRLGVGSIFRMWNESVMMSAMTRIRNASQSVTLLQLRQKYARLALAE